MHGNLVLGFGSSYLQFSFVAMLIDYGYNNRPLNQ